MPYLQERRERLFSHLSAERVVVLANGGERLRNPSNNWAFRGESHVIYLAGHLPPNAILVLVRGQAHIFVPVISVSEAVWCGSGESWEKLAQIHEAVVHPLEEVTSFVAELGLERCASLPVQDPAGMRQLREILHRDPDYKNCAVDLELAKALVEVRLVHDAQAQAEVRRACQLTVKAHLAGMTATRVGLDERDVLAAMMDGLHRSGSTTSFAPIVTTHSERLHQPYVGGELRDGELIEADFGVEAASGWAGDVTNTWPINGKFSAPQCDIYLLVLKAHRACAAMLRQGVRYLQVHEMADCVLAQGLLELGILRGKLEEVLQANAQAVFFVHGIGHLLGLDVHDMEDLGDLAGYPEGRERPQRFGGNCLRLDRDLRAGMAVTIEPGLYFIPELLDSREIREKYAEMIDWQVLERYRAVRGIRIERDYLITADGSELLTPGLPDTPEEIELVMRQGS